MGWRDLYSSSFSSSDTYDLGASKINLTDSSPAPTPIPPSDTSRGENERNHTNISAPQHTR